MRSPDPARWDVVSPYLDEALELSDEERPAWLTTLRARRPDVAGDVEAWLAQLAQLDRDGFLEDTSGVAPARTALAGLALGAYRLIEPIGEGGMGSVWLAERHDGRFEGRVAVKLLNPARVGRGGEARFVREGTILARLRHPQIAALLDAGVAPGGQPYLVLEYVDGLPIDRYCDRHELDVTARVRLFLEVLAPVAHAHANLVVHRDLKPSNVLVTADGRVTLLDFGIATLLEADGTPGGATLTRDGAAALTPAFAAPEQLTGEPITTATDVYAAGVLLYVLLTGRHPAGEAVTSPAAFLRAVIETDPPPPSSLGSRRLSGDLDTIALTALKKRACERYATVTAFADDLRRYLHDEPIRARGDAFAYRVRKFVRRNRTAVALASLAAAALAAGLAGTLTQARRAAAQRDFALHELSRAEAINSLNQFLLSDAAPLGGTFSAGDLLARAEQIATRPGSDSADNRVEMLIAIGVQYGTLDEESKSRRVLTQAYELSRGSAEPIVRAKAACALGDALAKNGETARARTLIGEGLAELPDAPQFALGRAFCHQRGSEAERNLGDPAAAIAHIAAAQGLVAAAPHASPLFTLRIAMDVAESYRVAGRHPQAAAAFADAYARLDALGRADTETASTLLNNWGVAHSLMGQPREAEQRLRRAVAISSAGGDANVSPMLLNNLARPLLELGRIDEATDLAERAFAKAESAGQEIVMHQSLLQRARSYRARGDLARAEAMLAELEPRLTKLYSGVHPAFGALYSERALNALARGDRRQAREALDRAMDIAAAMPDNRDGPPRYLMTRAAIALLADDHEAAIHDAREALQRTRAILGSVTPSSLTGEANLLLGQALLAAGRGAEAQAALAAAIPDLDATLGADHADSRRARTLANGGS